MSMISDEEVRSNIAANLLRILGDRGISLRELARRTGESPMTISRVCRGQILTSTAVMARIAEALDVSVDRLQGQSPKILEKSSRAY